MSPFISARNIIAEVENGEYTDIFVGKVANLSKDTDYTYNVTVDLRYLKSMQRDLILAQYQKCYDKAVKTVGTDSAHRRCKELVYGN